MKILSTSPSNSKARKRLEKVLEDRKTAEEGNQGTFLRMQKCDRQYIGDQWDPQARDANTDKGKFALSINQIHPTVQQLLGEEVQNPRDINVLPLKGNTSTRARLLSALIKNTLDEQYFDRKSSSLYANGIITARGFFTLDKDFLSGDPTNGNLKLGAPNPFMVLPDPTSRTYDYNAIGDSPRYVFLDKWMSKEMLHLWFPKRKGDMETAQYDTSQEGFWGGLWDSVKGTFFPQDGETFQLPDDYSDNSLEETDFAEAKARDNYRVSTMWDVRWVKGAYIQYVDTGQVQAIYDKDSRDRELARVQESGESVRIIESDGYDRPIIVPLLTRHTLVGDVLLQSIEDPFDGVMNIPVGRYAPYFRNGYEFGIVQNIIDAQMMANWSWSMVPNMIKKLANTGWMVSGGTPSDKEWLEANGDVDGVVIDRSEFAGDVQKIEQNPYPVGFDIVAEKSLEHMARISNVRREDPTFDRKNVPGVVLAMKREASQTGSAPTQMRFNWTREMVGRMVIEYIIHSKVYSPQEIDTIVDKEDLVDPALLDKAREIIKISLGDEDLEMPVPPDETILIRLPLERQEAEIRAYKEEVKQFDNVMGEIDELATPIAITMLHDEMDKLGQGGYGIKVALSQSSLTYRQTKRLETIELNDSLVNSGQQPLSRKTMIAASDIVNKQEEISTSQ